MRTILMGTIVTMSVVNLLYFFFKNYESVPRAALQPPAVNQPAAPQPVPALITAVNAANSQIITFACESAAVKLWQNGSRLKLNASIHYQKPNLFRMRVSSIFGEEVDIGSNTEIFWFWSRRSDERGLYYATYADFHKTRLKKPFNPIFTRESLGLDQIKTEGVRFVETEKEIVVVEPTINAVNQPIFKCTFVNKQTQKISGIILTDANGATLASAEIEYFGNIPQRILFTWHEEERVMLIEMREPTLNVQIATDTWTVPNISPKINMGQ